MRNKAPSTTAPSDQAAVKRAILLLANRWMVAVTVSPLGGASPVRRACLWLALLPFRLGRPLWQPRRQQNLCGAALPSGDGHFFDDFLPERPNSDTTFGS